MQTDAEAAGKPVDVGLWLAGQGVLFDFYLFFQLLRWGGTYARLAGARNPVFASRDANLACFRYRGCGFIR